MIYILGSGQMALALAKGLIKHYDLTIVARDSKKAKNFESIGAKVEEYGKSYDIDGKDIILAFKPYALDEILPLLKGEARSCISVLARKYLKDLEPLNAKEKLCCLPNIAAAYNSSITPYIASKGAKTAVEIISKIGEIYELKSDKELNIAGVLSGCAPAFLALVAESLQDGAIKEGLDKNSAKAIITALFKSTSALLSHTHPALLKEMISSPAGTTIKGIAALEEEGVRWAIIKAIGASSD